MSVTFFCPFCWAEGPTDVHICPECGKSLDLWNQTPFEDRLLHSLNHPITTQRMIAIHIPGMRRFAPALPVYESRRLLERLSHHPSEVVQKACEAVCNIGTKETLL